MSLKRKAEIPRFNPAKGPVWMNRGGPLNKVSKAHAAKKREERAAPCPNTEEGKFGRCFSCKKWAHLDRSHILPVGMNDGLRLNLDNQVGECRECHTSWGENLSQYARLYPVALAEKVARMEVLDHWRWALWMGKNGHLLAARPIR